MEFDHDISRFLSNAPLYKKLKTDTYIYSPWDFHEFGVKFYCHNENSEQTHKLELYPDATKKYFGGLSGGEPPRELLNRKTEQLYFVQHYKGQCQSCKSHFFDVLIEVSTDKSIYDNERAFTLRKLGQNPPNEIKPDKEFIDYLNNEDLENYKKALMNLSHSFGIGAYAYLRRVVENEILRLLKDLSELDFEHSDRIEELLDSHNKKHDMASLIDETFKYLPESLKTLGDNPFKLLYGELSVGIHKMNDNECLERATSLDAILKFVIKRINEEKNEVSVIKNAIKKLKN